MSEYSKYFRAPSIKLSVTIDDINAMTDEEFKKIEEKYATQGITHEDRLRFIEDMERNNGGCISWDMSCSFEEYARSVRTGEDIEDD